MIRFKTITTNFSTIVHVIVEPITSLAKKKPSMGSLVGLIRRSLVFRGRFGGAGGMRSRSLI